MSAVSFADILDERAGSIGSGEVIYPKIETVIERINDFANFRPNRAAFAPLVDAGGRPFANAHGTIECLTIGDTENPGTTELWIVGGIHDNEAVVLGLINEVLKAIESSGNAFRKSNTALRIFPRLNPGGYERNTWLGKPLTVPSFLNGTSRNIGEDAIELKFPRYAKYMPKSPPGVQALTQLALVARPSFIHLGHNGGFRSKKAYMIRSHDGPELLDEIFGQSLKKAGLEPNSDVHEEEGLREQKPNSGIWAPTLFQETTIWSQQWFSQNVPGSLPYALEVPVFVAEHQENLDVLRHSVFPGLPLHSRRQLVEATINRQKNLWAFAKNAVLPERLHDEDRRRIRTTRDGATFWISELERALASDPKSNLPLTPKDHVDIYGWAMRECYLRDLQKRHVC